MTAKIDLAQFQGFTPGPWFAQGIGPVYEITAQVSASDYYGAFIATTPPLMPGYHPLPVAERAANAKLCAAAPAILAYARDLEARNAKLAAALNIVAGKLEKFAAFISVDEERAALAENVEG